MQKDLRCKGLGKSSLFDAILVNPPFMPNPKNIATGASLLFGNGGDCGEEVLSAAVRLASCHLAPDGCLTAVSKVPNLSDSLEVVVERGLPKVLCMALPRG